VQKRRILQPFVLGALLAVWSAQAFGRAQEPELDVPYVPTPQTVVDEMLKLGNITKNDVLYDLGCGDGRIVITAAQKFGVRGVGVDIDPERIKESNANAKKAGVTDRVKFLRQDLFKTDFGEATVMTLYLLPEVNVKLRPRLLKELKPGTRIVSHDFDMGDWKPDKTVQVHSPDQEHTLFYWVIPANVEGAWQWSMPAGGGQGTLQLKQDYQSVSGNARIGGRATPITNAKLVGDRLSFTVASETGGKKATMRFSGRVQGGAIKGAVQVEGGPSAGKRDWTAKRNGPTPKTPA
jgi:SAM-dependent methyltransferase